MVVRAPPFQMGQQLWSLLGSRPDETCESGHPMADGQIHALNKSRVQASREA